VALLNVFVSSEAQTMTISTTSFNALLFVYASALCGTLGCVSSEKDAATGGTGGSTGTTGGSASATGGTTGTTGGTSTTGTGGAGTTANGAFPCATPTALITDFTYMDVVGAKTDTASFGDYTTTFSGGTFVYPGAGTTYPLTSDVTKGNWHVSGTVGDYSGFGLFFSAVNPATGLPGGCGKVDASAFKGIQFSISGSVAMAGSVTLTIGTAADDPASAWLNAHKASAADADKDPNFGRCMPITNQYDGTCGAPSKAIPVTATPTVVKVMWADLLGGKPEATVNPSEITYITWVLPSPVGAGTAAPTTYAADVTIDDLQFIP
jgi:hypothetical protein